MESKSAKKSVSSKVWLGVAILLLVLFVFDSQRKAINQSVADLKLSWQLRPYEQRVRDCFKEEEKKLNGKKVIGLDYSCAIQIASPLYAQNQELAMKLCMRHSPFDAGEQVLRIACTASFEKTISTSATTTNTLVQGSERQQPIGVTFENTKYHYRFTYPSESHLSNLDDLTQDVVSSRSVSVLNDKDQVIFSVEALDPDPLRAYSDFKKTVERYGWPLSQFADFIERQNVFQDSSGKGNLAVTTTIMVDGQKAYEFWFDGSVRDGDSERTLEPPRQIFVFAKPGQVILRVSYPPGLDQEPGDIFESLRWTP